MADLFRTVSAAMPPAPAIAGPPLAWGDPDHLRGLLPDVELEPTVERVPIDPEVDLAKVVDFYIGAFGPLLMARRALEPEGRWEPLVTQLRPVLERIVRDPATYLLTTGVKGAA